MFSKCMHVYGLGYSVVIIFIYKQQNSIVCVLLCSVVNVCIDLSYLKINLKDKFVEKKFTKLTKTHLKEVLGEKMAHIYCKNTK